MAILTGKLVSGPQLDPNENISARTGWIVMKLCTLIHCSQSLLVWCSSDVCIHYLILQSCITSQCLTKKVFLNQGIDEM